MNTARSAWPTLEEWASPAELVTSVLGAFSGQQVHGLFQLGRGHPGDLLDFLGRILGCQVGEAS